MLNFLLDKVRDPRTSKLTSQTYAARMHSISFESADVEDLLSILAWIV